MKSTIVPTKWRPDELAMLDRCRKSPKIGTLNRSEFLRLLVRREYSRRIQRTNSNVPTSAISSEWRNGRPAKAKKETTDELCEPAAAQP